MEYPNLIVSDQKEEFISIQRDNIIISWGTAKDTELGMSAENVHPCSLIRTFTLHSVCSQGPKD